MMELCGRSGLSSLRNSAISNQFTNSHANHPERTLLKDLEEEEGKKAAENSNMVHGFAFDTFRIVEHMKGLFKQQFQAELDHPNRPKNEVGQRRLRTAAEQGKRSAEQARHACNKAQEDLEKAKKSKLKDAAEGVEKAEQMVKETHNTKIEMCRIPANDLVKNATLDDKMFVVNLTLNELEVICISEEDVEIKKMKELKRIEDRCRILREALKNTSDLTNSASLIQEQAKEIKEIHLIKGALKQLVGKKGLRKAIVEVREVVGKKTFRKGLQTK